MRLHVYGSADFGYTPFFRHRLPVAGYRLVDSVASWLRCGYALLPLCLTVPRSCGSCRTFATGSVPHFTRLHGLRLPRCLPLPDGYRTFVACGCYVLVLSVVHRSTFTFTVLRFYTPFRLRSLDCCGYTTARFTHPRRTTVTRLHTVRFTLVYACGSFCRYHTHTLPVYYPFCRMHTRFALVYVWLRYARCGWLHCYYTHGYTTFTVGLRVCALRLRLRLRLRGSHARSHARYTVTYVLYVY